MRDATGAYIVEVIWPVWTIQRPGQRRQSLVEAAYRPQFLCSWIENRISVSLNHQVTQLGMTFLMDRIEDHPI